MKSALKRSLTVLMIAGLSLLAGVIYSTVLDRLDRRSYPLKFSEYVNTCSEEYGVPHAVIYAVIRTESSFDATAVSHAGAIGLMQIMPDTFEWLQTHLHDEYETGMLYDPETNIRYGTYLLSYLYTQFGRWDTVFAAYNAGIGRVRGWLADETYSDENGNLVTIPIKETRDYVNRVRHAEEKYTELYGEIFDQ